MITEDFFRKTRMGQKNQLINSAIKYGETRVITALKKMELKYDNKYPNHAKELRQWINWLDGSFKRKKFVGFSEGF